MKRPTAEMMTEWRERLRDSGFRDIELPGGDLKLDNHRHDQGYPVPLPDDDAHDYDQHYAYPLAGAKTLAELSAPYDHYLAALWRFPFTDERDWQICELLSRAASVRSIIAAGHSRRSVYRMLRELAAWVDPDAPDKPTDDEGSEP